MGITYYGLTTCPVCRKVKDFLDRSGAEYDCVFVDKLTGQEREAAVREVTRHNPRGAYPTVVVHGAAVVGMDLEALGKLLEARTG